MRRILWLLVYLLFGLCVEAFEPADHQASLPWSTSRQSPVSLLAPFSSAASYQNLYSLTLQPLATPTPTPISLTSLGELYYLLHLRSCAFVKRSRSSEVSASTPASEALPPVLTSGPVDCLDTDIYGLNLLSFFSSSFSWLRSSQPLDGDRPPS